MIFVVKNEDRKALLAQLVEHLTLNQGVQGSSPWRRTQGTGFAAYKLWGRCFFCVQKENSSRHTGHTKGNIVENGRKKPEE